MLSYASGADITVVDRLGLGDPIGSRIAVGARRRPGHEKELDLAWVVARYAEPALSFPDDPGFEARVVAARAAVRCGPLGRLLDAVSRPLTARRMAANARLALTTYGARVSGNPVEVRAAYC
jgi:arabinofuranosyltransferase